LNKNQVNPENNFEYWKRHLFIFASDPNVERTAERIVAAGGKITHGKNLVITILALSTYRMITMEEPISVII